MLLNPLSPVTDYQSMLNRIFWFTTASTLVAIWLLRLEIPPLDGLLRQIDFTLELGGEKIVPVPGGYLFPALIVALASRIFRLHARISSWLGIRECFDIEVIINELAAQVGVDLGPVDKHLLVRRRHAVMRETFYRYVSGPQPMIDPQLVQQALDAWSWFWIGVEATLIFSLTSFGLIAGSAYQTGFLCFGGTLLVAAVALPTMRNQCRLYAVAQVRAITADPVRAGTVRALLVELEGARALQRRAA